MSTGHVHLLYGLAGSGKTTLARALCADGGAVRFSLDEWMIRLFPDLAFSSAEYTAHAECVKDLIWSIAEQVVRSGIDVVLDWNAWSRQRRAWAVRRAAAVPTTVILHRLTTPIEQATTRLDGRDSGTAYVHSVDRRGNEHLATIMQPPSQDEGFQVTDH